MTLIKSISGIRGTIGGEPKENLTPIDIIKFSTAFAAFLQQKNPEKRLKVILGRDARISGEIINRLVASTLQSMGLDVIDTGLSTTPTVEMAVILQQADGGIILTASHNPMEWNALKLLNEKGEFISAEDARILLTMADDEHLFYADVLHLGNYIEYNRSIEDHIDTILALPLVDIEAIRFADFRVILDVVNSTGAISLPPLLEKLGVDHVKVLNSVPNGRFAHNPEPLPEHLTQISEEMQKGSYDVGFVVDPDVDRLAIIMEDGEMFGEEYTLVAVADYVLQHRKGAAVSNLSSTKALEDLCEKYGVDVYKSAVGEVNVVEMMKAKSAVIGGEGNGGVIYPELHYGRDALVGIALFLTHLAKSKVSCSQLKMRYSHYDMIKYKVNLKKEMDISTILSKIVEKYRQYHPNTIDGVKIDFGDSWVHLRTSNTEPIIRIYAEASTAKQAKALIEKMEEEIGNS